MARAVDTGVEQTGQRICTVFPCASVIPTCRLTQASQKVCKQGRHFGEFSSLAQIGHLETSTSSVRRDINEAPMASILMSGETARFSVTVVVVCTDGVGFGESILLGEMAGRLTLSTVILDPGLLRLTCEPSLETLFKVAWDPRRVP